MRRPTTASLVLTLAASGLLLGAPTALGQEDQEWKIGVVTDVGTVDDKNFNEYTYVGANAGAEAIGVPTPVPVVVPADPSEFAQLIQAYVDQDFDIIVTAGFNLGVATTQAAHDNPDIWFIGVDQGPPCVTEEGLPDTTFTCAGNAAELLPRFIALSFQEDQAGYLAGIVAASVSQTGTLAAIGGITLCGPCIRYIQGFELGAKSVNPDVQVVTSYVTDSNFDLAFNAPVEGKQYAADLLLANPDVDVFFQVAGKTGNGMLEAVCEAGLIGVGVDVDQALSHPPVAPCTVTSATKSLVLAVRENIEEIAAGTATGGDDHYDASRDGIGIAPYHELEGIVPPEVQGLVDTALAAMQAGELQTCPENCGRLQ